MELNKNELLNIIGGGYGVWAVIGGFIAFLISTVEGFINPIKCGK